MSHFVHNQTNEELISDVVLSEHTDLRHLSIQISNTERLTNPKPQNPIVLQVCKFDNQIKLMRNLIKQCPNCNKPISNGHLSRHLPKCLKGLDRKKNKTCHVCGKTFSQVRALNYHHAHTPCGKKLGVDDVIDYMVDEAK